MKTIEIFKFQEKNKEEYTLLKIVEDQDSKKYIVEEMNAKGEIFQTERSEKSYLSKKEKMMKRNYFFRIQGAYATEISFREFFEQPEKAQAKIAQYENSRQEALAEKDKKNEMDEALIQKNKGLYEWCVQKKADELNIKMHLGKWNDIAETAGFKFYVNILKKRGQL